MRLSNIPFRIESTLVRVGYAALGARPTSRPFVSGDTFRALGNLIYEGGILKNVKPAGLGVVPIVFVHSSEIPDFFKHGSRDIPGRYVLISNNGDENIGQSHIDALDARAIHWFAHNAMIRHEKLTCIPIGLENARLHCNGIVRDFRYLRRHTDHLHKRPRVLTVFTVGNNPVERGEALTALRASQVSTEIERTNSREYRNRLSQFMFVASPPGNGFDCHRTWEALYLGVVPVVKKHPYYDQFPDLPLLRLNDWSEIGSYTEEMLAEEYLKLVKRFETSQTLWMDYWQNKIEACRREGEK